MTIKGKDRVVVKKDIIEVDILDTLLAQNKIMTQQLANLSKRVESLNTSAVSFPSISCDFCGDNHSSGECPRNMFGQLLKKKSITWEIQDPKMTHFLIHTIRVGEIIQISHGAIKATKELLKDHHSHIKHHNNHFLQMFIDVRVI
ncbi:hypothetical protein L6164_008564 [Bauhinia variegata]|uniref:Uncharacterized protein n=1 Tax=Bauhinia variegata TaxID=167791 RepID=A0ACB9PH18_BAUVA|nr:hypothetical protein L6164_008564 [Bauhinia variegata]